MVSLRHPFEFFFVQFIYSEKAEKFETNLPIFFEVT